MWLWLFILVLGLFKLAVDNTRNVNWMGGWVVSFSLRGCFLLQLSPSLYFQPTTSCVQSTFSHRANISQHRHRPVYFLAYRTRNLLSCREFTHFLVYFYRPKWYGGVSKLTNIRYAFSKLTYFLLFRIDLCIFASLIPIKDVSTEYIITKDQETLRQLF